MKLFVTLLFSTLVCILPFSVNAQEILSSEKKIYENKGKLFFYWGWNKSVYSRSTIHFYGRDYSFRLNRVKATDRQSPLSWDYIHPKRMTIPQYNFRIGYFFADDWSISFGNDHMKYVVVNGQVTTINGKIYKQGSVFEGDYNDEEINLSPDFLQFEHTDGLNYENIEIRHFTELYKGEKHRLLLIEGGGGGLMYPKTNSTLMGMERNDAFHIAGFALAAVSGLKMDCNNGFFIQTELKGGFINLYDIETTKYSEDWARQHFFFFQYNFVLGYKFQFLKS